ncbi:MAG TPA: porin family protein [Chitinophagaceae bacterium]|jgi:hypothetical protein|nr:porin family protein [Chitinophagaceae bacterium]
MKKISLIALALCVNAALFAQETQPQLRTPMAVKTRFGIRAGANLANVRLNEFKPNEPDVNQKTSIHAGIFANIPISPMLRFQPGVEYSGQGSKVSKYNLVGSAATTAYEQDLTYLNVPLMLQYVMPSGFMIEAGPQPGWLLNASQDGPGDTDTDNHRSFDKFNLSIGAGLGYLSRIGLGINARYNFGLTNTLEDDNNSSNNGPEVKNQVFQVGLVYQFGAGK